MIEDDALININLANVETLARLPGIGEQLADRIVQYRETVHPFAEVIELTAVPGISERMVREFAAQITVGSFAAPDEADTEKDADPAAETIVVDPILGDEAEQAADANGEVAALDASSEVVAESVDIAEQDVAVALADMEEEREEEVEPPAAIAGPEAAADPPAVTPERKVETAVNATVFTSPPISRRRGCLFTVLAALLGALLGIGATLGILALLNNGNLAFSATDARIESELAGARAAQGDLETQVLQLERALSAMATRTGELAGELATSDEQIVALETEAGSLASQLATAEAALSDTQTDVATLDETAEQLASEIETVNVAAETFNTFLDRLRDMLLDLQGEPPASADPTAEAEPTATVEPTATPAATATATRLPTRTPRPTATPFATATTDAGE